MLADQRGSFRSTGRLDDGLRLQSTWRYSLLSFIAEALPAWRDDSDRPAASSETVLTAQLCAMLNSLTRRSGGWDYLQFRMEEPDEATPGRAIDLVAAPSGEVIWIEGRRFSQYQTLLPLECKRLPTPVGRTRDEREYLHSRHGSRGGVQRFKAGHHGAAHDHAALIAYIQSGDADVWRLQLQAWIDALASNEEGWTAADQIALDDDDAARGLTRLSSSHSRTDGLGPIRLSHIWVRM